MSYAVRIGTTEAVWNDNNPAPSGWVLYDGDITPDLIWDDTLQNLRPRNAAETLAHAKAERIDAIRAEARTRIESVYPEWRQRSAALGVYPAEYVSTMQAGIAAVIAASNAGEDAVDAAADVAAVEAVTVTWPVI